jgi:hypothetical protein
MPATLKIPTRGKSVHADALPTKWSFKDHDSHGVNETIERVWRLVRKSVAIFVYGFSSTLPIINLELPAFNETTSVSQLCVH